MMPRLHGAQAETRALIVDLIRGDKVHDPAERGIEMRALEEKGGSLVTVAMGGAREGFGEGVLRRWRVRYTYTSLAVRHLCTRRMVYL
jgi:hypothetical protein